MKKLVLTVILALSVCIQGCSRSDVRSPITDADLKKEIESKFSSDPELSSSSLTIRADALANTATISGIVESQELRARAGEVAKSAHAGLTVVDELKVKRRELSRSEFTEQHARAEQSLAKEKKERLGKSINDAWIHATVITRLIGETGTQESGINVDVMNGIVTLRGTVATKDEKTEAERISKQTEGVKRVSNLLKVSKS